MNHKVVKIGKSLSVDDVCLVAFNNNIKVELDTGVLEKVKVSRNIVENIMKGNKAVYGINT